MHLYFGRQKKQCERFTCIFHLSSWQSLSICAYERKRLSRRKCFGRPQVCSWVIMFSQLNDRIDSDFLQFFYICISSLHLQIIAVNKMTMIYDPIPSVKLVQKIFPVVGNFEPITGICGKIFIICTICKCCSCCELNINF